MDILLASDLFCVGVTKHSQIQFSVANPGLGSKAVEGWEREDHGASPSGVAGTPDINPQREGTNISNALQNNSSSEKTATLHHAKGSQVNTTWNESLSWEGQKNEISMNS